MHPRGTTSHPMAGHGAETEPQLLHRSLPTDLVSGIHLKQKENIAEAVTLSESRPRVRVGTASTRVRGGRCQGSACPPPRALPRPSSPLQVRPSSAQEAGGRHPWLCFLTQRQDCGSPGRQQPIARGVEATSLAFSSGPHLHHGQVRACKSTCVCVCVLCMRVHEQVRLYACM